MSLLLARRIAMLVVTLVAASIALFLVLDILPGDPALVMLGTEARPDTLAALRREMGLDQPALVRYVTWIGGVAVGDFGISYTWRVPVASLIAERLAVTVPLAVMAIVLSTLIAVPVGVIAAAAHGRTLDWMIVSFAQVGVAVPNFWIGILLVLGFSIGLGWFPAGGFPGWQAGVGAGLSALILPSVALALPQAAILARVTRSAVLEVVGEDYIRTARAKGLTARQALWRHGLRNALIPVVTILGLQVPVLIAGAILIENVFALPGLGRLIFQALGQRDLIVLKDVALLLAGLAIIVNGLVDIAYTLIDPRLKDRLA
ncbi:MAG: ABC transporter permease [Alphaproteobacteria bacterium]|nr:ABC transporter permease [Alphaproteobacteria bacterium]